MCDRPHGISALIARDRAGFATSARGSDAGTHVPQMSGARRLHSHSTFLALHTTIVEKG
jgi:hypothetical protein